MIKFLASNRFWAIILGVFVFQASWIAITARYPMAFDEQFHLGIIRLYADHLSPFWNGQPSGAEAFGAVSRDPSYLYQWLLSFPYRVISTVTSSETAQVIALRLLNVGILASALMVFRKLLGQLGASNQMRNVVMAFFVLTPVVPLLGAQINYDNTMVLMTALAFSTFLGLRSALRTTSVWHWNRLTQLLLICIFASLVKYAFLPIAAGLTIAVFFEYRYALKHKVNISTKLILNKQAVLYLVVLVAGVGMFSERYLVNIVRYHTPIPECNQVLSIEECQGYAPWARNFMFESWDVQTTRADKLTYPFTWVHRALGETVFTITSRYNDKGTVSYFGATQLPVTNVLSWIVFIGGGLLAIFNWRYIRQNKALCVLLAVSGLYVLALFAQNLMDFLHLGFPVAIHGRYLLPILPLLYLVIALSVGRLLQTQQKALLSAAVLLIFATQGGGFVTFIARSQDDWFWPQSRPAQVIHHYARNVTNLVVIK